MLGQHRGDVVAEEGGVVEVLDIGAVDTEDVVDATRREVRDDVIDNPMPVRHISPVFRKPPPVTRLATELGSLSGPNHRCLSSRTFPLSDETSCTAAISSFCNGVVALGSAVAPDSPSHVAI